ncbi:Acid-sensing ion channel 4-A [Merluccius polli]|uniref:Acid-sensing ion channel 4-A n=1 Tax=Merluccius polli TaxID=89951 RepID=A0AA47MS66_MERPO|nr:Acid-sensing ion channel 4-A [Merluccius polli]
MPIEFVCKIKFAEEDEKQKAKQDGDTESLIEESCARPAKDLAGFANSCSLHGINHIFVSGRLGIRQTLWALAFVASLVLFLYQAAKCAISYLEHPHVTALNEEASPEMVFPAVTICNINRFRFSALTDADIYHLANLTGLPPKNKDGHRPTDLEYPAPDMQDIFNRTGHQLEEMLMSCNFSGQNCSVEDFSVSFCCLLEKGGLFQADLAPTLSGRCLGNRRFTAGLHTMLGRDRLSLQSNRLPALPRLRHLLCSEMSSDLARNA